MQTIREIVEEVAKRNVPKDVLEGYLSIEELCREACANLEVRRINEEAEDYLARQRRMA